MKKPRPITQRIGRAGGKRRAAGWMMLALGVLVAGVWALSLWWSITLKSGRWLVIYGDGHVSALAFGPDPIPEPGISFSRHEFRPGSIRWLSFAKKTGWTPETFSWNIGLVSHAADLKKSFAGWSFVVWPVLLLLVTGGGLLLRSGTTARRRALTGRCKACGYSLAGLAAGTACPECGKAAAPSLS